MESLRVSLFGFPRVEREGQSVPVNRRKMLAMLAYLLVTGQPHSREALAALLWPDFDSSSALANLRRDLSRLKEILGERVLLIARDKVQVAAHADVWVDTAHFEASLRQAEQHGHFNPTGAVSPPCAHCQAALQAAAALYTDSFLAGFNLPDSPAFDEWQFFQAERLRGMLSGVLIHLSHWKIAQGAYEDAIQPARRWLALDALHEPAQRMMMQLYAWTGQPSAALRQYQALVDLLQQELGVEPDPETTALNEAIRSRRLTPPVQVAPAALIPDTAAPDGVADAARYQLESLLSSGGFGEIYRGRDRLTGSAVAVKRLQPSLIARRPELVKRFLREAQALGQLSHPNIVPMLAFYEQDGQYNLVMEYLPGGTLRHLLDDEQPLPVERALDIALELADALSRAHHLQILHRDLKPENILLDGDGHPRLIDFGLALLDVSDSRLTQAGTIMGSPAYMSPEAIRGEDLDARSDIWSFGVLLYEMLAGRLPFAGEQLHSLIQQILYEPLPDLRTHRPQLPPALASLVARMLAREPDQRLPSMRQAAAELEAIRSGKTTPLLPSPAPHASAQQESDQHAPSENGSQLGSDVRLLELPAQPTPLIGREADLAQLDALLNNPDSRLVTLTGTGGIGKTRLAVEAAARMAGTLPNGVVFVPMAPLSEDEFILPAIANALHFRFSPGSDPKEQLLNRLSGMKLLLVLDNFEHLLSAVDLLAEILAGAPHLRLLVTSRERLNLQEEWVYEVSGLPYPPPGESVPGGAGSWLENFSAVHMFVERARRADPHLQLDDDSLAAVIRICQLVEGIPLAIELAAPWVRAMTCAEIAHELEHNLDLLTTSMRNLPERHRSLRVVIEQSWQSLLPLEQKILSRFSVFHNGCTRDAAEKVAGARPANLMTLVDKALLRHRGSRFEMHELVRQYAAERLSEDPQHEHETLDCHYHFYLEQGARLTSWLKGGRQLEAANEITFDIDNIRTAWRLAVERRDEDLLLQAAESAWLYCEFRGQLVPGEAAFRMAVEAFQPESSGQVLVGFLRVAQGSMLARQWQVDRGRVLMQQGLALLRAADPPDPEKIAFALAWYAFMQVMHGQFREAALTAEESLSYFPVTNDRWTQAGALRLLGASALYLGQLQRAEEILDQCVEVCKSIGELRIRTYATANLGVICLWYGQLDQARKYFSDSLRVSKSSNDRLSRADALCEHGRMLLASGEYDRAIETARTCIDLYKELGRPRVSLANIVMGKALRLKREPGAEEALNEGLEVARSVNHRPDIAAGLEGLGSLALDRKNYSLAGRYFGEALAIWTEIGNEPEISTLLCRSAYNLIASGAADNQAINEQFTRALRLSLKHKAGTIAISALVGLAAHQLRTGEVDASRAALMFLYAHRHPATPQEVRSWSDAMLQQMAVDISPLEDHEIYSIDWQVLAERWQHELSLA